MIPKIIHYCWFGGGVKSECVLMCIESWEKCCPDYEIREWTEKDFDVNSVPYVKEAYEAQAWGFVPDYIRLWIVYNHGGIYLDTDVQLIRSLDLFLDCESFMGFESGIANFVNNGQGFGAVKGNWVIKQLMEHYNGLHYLNEDNSFNRTPSPIYTTEALEKLGLQRSSADKIQYLNGVTVYPSEYFCPKSLETGVMHITENTYAIHHFSGSWLSLEEKLSQKKHLVFTALKKHNLTSSEYQHLISPWIPAETLCPEYSRFCLCFLVYNLSRYSYHLACFLYAFGCSLYAFISIFKSEWRENDK